MMKVGRLPVRAVSIIAVLTVTSLVPVSTYYLTAKPRGGVRPIAEFEPVEAVVISEYVLAEAGGRELLDHFANDGIDTLVMAQAVPEESELASFWEQYGISKVPENVTLAAVVHDSQWIRDYGGIMIRSQGNHTAPRFGIADFTYHSDGGLDDIVPYQLGIFYTADVAHVPLALDGGNFLTDGSRCFLGLSFYESYTMLQESLVHSIAPERNTYLESLQERLGCEKVIFFEQVPHEHIDMWSKILDLKTVIVNQIDPKALSKAISEEPDMAQGYLMLSHTLDRLANEYKKHFRKVIRIPQPLPSEQTFFTYTNATLINGKAYLPRYELEPERLDHAFQAHYEESARRAYESAGFAVRFARADGFISNGGAIHCVTLTIPKLPREAARIKASAVPEDGAS